MKFKAIVLEDVSERYQELMVEIVADDTVMLTIRNNGRSPAEESIAVVSLEALQEAVALLRSGTPPAAAAARAVPGAPAAEPDRGGPPPRPRTEASGFKPRHLAKRLLLIGVGTLITASLAAGYFAFCFTASPPAAAQAELKSRLENVYRGFQTAIAQEDPFLLRSVLTSSKVRMYTEMLRENGGYRFPEDYFRLFKPVLLVLPSLDRLQYVGLTFDSPHANLVYLGSLRGCMGNTTDDRRFFVVQFEQEADGWKYVVGFDTPAGIVMDLDRRLTQGDLSFLKQRPFKPERIDLLP